MVAPIITGIVMKTWKQAASAAMAAAVLGASLVACGGSESANAEDNFKLQVADLMKIVFSLAGLKSTDIPDSFDDSFLDAGYTKAQLKQNVADEAVALGTTADLSLYPLFAVTNSSISGCDSDEVCDMTAVWKNEDVDANEVTFTTKVKKVNGSYRFYGDQKAS